MDGIEILFPVQVCRDILENYQHSSWRTYEASISTTNGKNEPRVSGCLKTRLLSSDEFASDTHDFVDLILTFPQNAVKYNGRRGVFYCRAENVTAIYDTSNSRPTESSLSQTKQDHADQELEEDDNSVEIKRRTYFRNKRKSCDQNLISLGNGEGNITTQNHQPILDSITPVCRPARKREIPTRLKDYQYHVSDKFRFVNGTHTSTKSTTTKQVLVSDCGSEETEEDININTPKWYPDSVYSHTRWLKCVTLTPLSSQSISMPPSSHCSQNQQMTEISQNVNFPRPSPISVDLSPTQLQPKSSKRKYAKLIADLHKSTWNIGMAMKSVISDYDTKLDRRPSHTSQDIKRKHTGKDSPQVLQKSNFSGRKKCRRIAASACKKAMPTDLTEKVLEDGRQLQTAKLKNDHLETNKQKTFSLDTLKESVLHVSPSNSIISNGVETSYSYAEVELAEENLRHSCPRPRREQTADTGKLNLKTTFHPDHDYADFSPSKDKLKFSTKPLKTLTKSLSLSQHIQARVEKIEESNGNSLVTICGFNKSKQLDVHSFASEEESLQLNHEGLPIVNFLDDAMTDTLKRRQKHKENLHLALPGETTAPVPVDAIDMTVANEVILSDNGRSHRLRKRPPPSSRGRQAKSVSSLANGEESISFGMAANSVGDKGADVISNVSDFFKGMRISQSSNRFVIEMTTEGLSPLTGEHCGDRVLDEGDMLSKKSVESVDGTNDVSGSKREAVCIENSMGDNIHQSLSKMCQYCLRFFSSSFLLYRHVKRYHTAHEKSKGYQAYIKQLQQDNCIPCPYCPEGTYLSNQYKLRSHLSSMHAVRFADGESLEEVVWPVSSAVRCEICQVHFHTQSELSAHATLVHDRALVTCSQCSATFVSEAGIQQHNAQVHAHPSSLTCICGQVFTYKKSLDTHRQKVHGLPPETPAFKGFLEASTDLKRKRCSQSKASMRPSPSNPPSSSMQQKKEVVVDLNESTECPFCAAVFSRNCEADFQLHLRQVHDISLSVSESADLGTELTLKTEDYHDSTSNEVSTAEKEATISPHYVKSTSALPLCYDRSVSGNQTYDEESKDVKGFDNFPVTGSETSSEITGSLLEGSLTTFVNEVETEEMDIFSTLPMEVQQSLRLIAQDGQTAVLTIEDGNGGLQKITFTASGVVHSQDLSPVLLFQSPQFIADSDTRLNNEREPVLFSDNSVMAESDQFVSFLQALSGTTGTPITIGHQLSCGGNIISEDGLNNLYNSPLTFNYEPSDTDGY